MTKQYFPVPSGDLLFYCGPDLYRVHDGNLQWKFTWRSEYKSDLVIDKAETVYAMESFDNKSFNDKSESHVVAISAGGEKKWGVGFREGRGWDMFICAGGQIFFTPISRAKHSNIVLPCFRGSPG